MLDCDACDAPSGEEHRCETFEAYADYCNYGSRYGRESIILGCAERVRKLVYYVLKEDKVHRKRYHTVGPDLFGAGLLAIVKAASDPAKFRPVGQGSEEVVYCDRTGEIREGGDDEITAIRKYLKTVAERAMWGEFKRVPLVYVPPSTARNAKRRGKPLPEAPEEKQIGHDAFAAIEDPGLQNPFLTIETLEALQNACTEPLDAELIRLKYKGIHLPENGSRVGNQHPTHFHPDRRAGLSLSSPCSPSRSNHSLGQLPRSPPSGLRGWAGRWFLAIPSSATSSHQRNSHEPHPQRGPQRRPQ